MNSDRREFRCDTQDFVIANTLWVCRWIAAALAFAAVIVAWVFDSTYQNVILGIFVLYVLQCY